MKNTSTMKLNFRSMPRRLSKDEVRKALRARRMGKKVMEVNWDNTQSKPVNGNMTFYFDNVLIQTKPAKPFNEIVAYIEIDGTRRKDHLEIMMGSTPSTEEHLKARMEGRVLSPDVIAKVVREGLTVHNHAKRDDGPGAHFNSYYYLDDKCVIGTTVNKGQTVLISTAYRITPIGDVGFLSDRVNWLIKKIGYKSNISRCYVIDRTASDEWQKNDLVHMIPGILSSVASLAPHEREVWSQNETIRHIMDQTQKLKASLNVIPWDSQHDLGKSFTTHPKHDYSFVVEVDNDEDIYIDAQRRLKDFGLDTNQYKWSGTVLPNPTEYSQAFMFDLRDYSGDEHTWAKTRTRRPNSHATNNKSY